MVPVAWGGPLSSPVLPCGWPFFFGGSLKKWNLISIALCSHCTNLLWQFMWTPHHSTFLIFQRWNWHLNVHPTQKKKKKERLAMSLLDPIPRHTLSWPTPFFFFLGAYIVFASPFSSWFILVIYSENISRNFTMPPIFSMVSVWNSSWF